MDSRIRVLTGGLELYCYRVAGVGGCSPPAFRLPNPRSDYAKSLGIASSSPTHLDVGEDARKNSSKSDGRPERFGVTAADISIQATPHSSSC